MTDVTQSQLHPRVRYLDRNGQPLAGGKVYAYELGTTIAKTTYSDATGLVPNSQPVILDSAGQANIFGSGLYTLIILDHNDVPVDSIDGEAYYSEGSEVLGTLAGSTGAGLVGFLQRGTGARLRTVQDKLRDVLSVMDFGAIGDGVLHPLSERFSTLAAAQAQYPFVQALTQSIDWAAFQAAANTKYDLIAPEGIYVLNERLDLYSRLTGAGCDVWDQKGSWRPRQMGKGTTLLMADTPLAGNYVTVDCVSNCDVGGGVLANDNAALVTSDNMPGNLNYALLDYTNGNAVGATMATPKRLKVGVRLFAAAKVVDLRVQLNYSGIDGYNSTETLVDFPAYGTSYKGLGDNWDIGVLSYNAQFTGVSNCQVVGYWRMAARAVVSANFGDGKSFGGAVFDDDGVYYQGFVGLSIRGNDTYRILSSTASTLTVAWSASHQIPPSGTAYISGVAHSYSGLSFDGVASTLTLTGFVDDISVLPSRPRLTLGTNPAFAGSGVANGFITDLNHFSSYRAYDLGVGVSFANPGHAHEISGNPLRDIDFTNIHFFANDCIGFLHTALHISYSQCYAEATGYSSSIVDVVSVTKGARYIATARPDSVDIRVPNSSGWCRGLVWDYTSELSDGSVDMYPMYRPTTTGYRFSGTAKWFMPDDVAMDAVGYWSDRNVGFRTYNTGTRRFLSGSPLSFNIVTPSFQSLFFIDGSTTGAENIGFGTTNPATSLHIVKSEFPSIKLEQTLLGSAQDPNITFSTFAGTWTIRPQNSSINQFQFRFGNNPKFQIDKTSGTIFSGVDNSADIGMASNKYKTIYAYTSAIGTSDSRHKQQWRSQSDSERAAALAIKAVIGSFRFNDAVELKGDGARWHIGVKAQEIIQIMSDKGLEPMNYAFVCYDEWAEVLEVKDEAGEILVPYQAAGNIYGIRYEELAMFILAAI